MRYFKDSILLMFYSLFLIFYARIDSSLVLSFLSALILCCLSSFEDFRRLILALFLLFVLLSGFYPAFLIFMPAAAYALLNARYQFLLLLGAAAYGYHFFIAENIPLSLMVSGLFGLVLAFYLSRVRAQYEKLNEDFKHSRDDSTEMNLLLTEKNQTLLDRQDYEIYTATLKERNRIAREIHDNVGHLLSRSILMVGAMKAVNKETSMKEPLNTLDSTLNSAMDSIRESVHDLHDDAINLEEAVKTLIQDFTFCDVSFKYDMGRDISRGVKYAFISITKEALSNVMKHSNASRVHIVMREHPALYQLSIEDNGTSFTDGQSGIGLSNMQERVRSLNGNIKILHENGFKIFITIQKGVSP